jgi:hypothetical protein
MRLDLHSLDHHFIVRHVVGFLKYSLEDDKLGGNDVVAERIVRVIVRIV